jgi:hypothetical protein
MGYLDRILRIIAGLVLIYIGFFATEIVDNTLINILLGLLGLLNVAAALTAFCPVYTLAHISTDKNKNNPS